MRVLGIDYGKRRIGLALSDPSGTLARPWRVLRPESGKEALSSVTDLISALRSDEEGLVAIVIGFPKSLDGALTDLTRKALSFGEQLGSRVGLPIHFEDERLSSLEADQRLAQNERDWRKRKQKLDAAAAAVILQDYLDRQRDGREAADR